MKRSEMIQKINRLLSYLNGLHIDDRADFILWNLEQEGMLPPESEGKTLYGILTDNKWDKE